MSIGSSSSVNEGTYYYDGGNYSTTETETGKLWTDGKMIYRKVVDFGALPNATTKNTAHGISTIETLINVSGIATSGTSYYPLPAPRLTANLGVAVSLSGTNISIVTGTNWSGYNGMFTLEYTKV